MFFKLTLLLKKTFFIILLCGCLFLLFCVIVLCLCYSWEGQDKIIIDKISAVINQIKDVKTEKCRVLFFSDTRTIHICGFINANVAYQVSELLFALDKSGKNDSFLYISSNGGNLSAVFQIIDTIKLVSNKVNTVAIGQCYDASTYLLLAGSGKRYANTNCIISVRNNSLFTANSPFDKLQSKRIDTLMNNTKISDLKNNSTSQLFITTEEAIKYCLIDDTWTMQTK